MPGKGCNGDVSKGKFVGTGIVPGDEAIATTTARVRNKLLCETVKINGVDVTIWDLVKERNSMEAMLDRITRRMVDLGIERKFPLIRGSKYDVVEDGWGPVLAESRRGVEGAKKTLEWSEAAKLPEKLSTVKAPEGWFKMGAEMTVTINALIDCVEELSDRSCTLLSQQETDQWRVMGPGKIEDRLEALEKKVKPKKSKEDTIPQPMSTVEMDDGVALVNAKHPSNRVTFTCSYCTFPCVLTVETNAKAPSECPYSEAGRHTDWVKQ